MMPASLFLPGGAGFVGSNLALMFRHHYPQTKIVVLDNLKRRGAESVLGELRDAGITFVHGDIRCPEDIAGVPDYELVIDCSAEPSVQAGLKGDALALINTNLVGTVHLLEDARRRGAAFLLLSTSRVFPIPALNALPFVESATRFEWTPAAEGCADRPAGWSAAGVAEDFPLAGPRSLYGASKLAGELLLAEYAYSYGMAALINRCGVLAGPRQWGKVDQGVITLWTARHRFQQPLKYIGFGGTGKQVRDVLHVADLFDLIAAQLKRRELWDGRAYNVGGGAAVSTSLVELTDVCQQITGHRVPITADPATSSVDLRIYLTDARHAQADFAWKPTRDLPTIVRDIHAWLADPAAARHFA